MAPLPLCRLPVDLPGVHTRGTILGEVYTTTTTRVRVRGRGRVRVRGRGRGSVRVRVRPGGGLQVGSLYPDPSTYPYSYCYP